MKVLFVGISNKLGKEPFDELTNSGKIVKKIIDNLNCETYKLNIVSYAPIDDNKKLRYPTKEEINKEIPIFMKKVDKIRPDIIVLFGNIVCDSLKKINFKNIKIIKEKHPSYMYVYRRKYLDEYIIKIVEQINI